MTLIVTRYVIFHAENDDAFHFIPVGFFVNFHLYLATSNVTFEQIDLSHLRGETTSVSQL